MTNVSRRSVAKGAAWAVPAVTVASAAPAMAASAEACSSANAPDAQFVNHGDAASSTQYQVRTSLASACDAYALPAGTVVRVTITNTGSNAEQYKILNYNGGANYSTDGAVNGATIAAGKSVVITNTTVRAITPGSTMGMFFQLSYPGTYVVTYEVVSLPAGYTDHNTANNVWTETI